MHVEKLHCAGEDAYRCLSRDIQICDKAAKCGFDLKNKNKSVKCELQFVPLLDLQFSHIKVSHLDVFSCVMCGLVTDDSCMAFCLRIYIISFSKRLQRQL